MQTDSRGRRFWRHIPEQRGSAPPLADEGSHFDPYAEHGGVPIVYRPEEREDLESALGELSARRLAPPRAAGSSVKAKVFATFGATSGGGDPFGAFPDDLARMVRTNVRVKEVLVELQSRVIAGDDLDESEATAVLALRGAHLDVQSDDDGRVRYRFAEEAAQSEITERELENFSADDIDGLIEDYLKLHVRFHPLRFEFVFA